MRSTGDSRITNNSQYKNAGGHVSEEFDGVEIRHLRAFVAVAESGTFSAAAVRLGCTQSAVSQQIAGLERAISHRLFIRSSGGRPLALTTAGQLLLSHSGPLIAHITAVRSDLAILAAEDLPVVRVGTFGSASVRLLPQIIRGFLAAWNGVHLELCEKSDDDELVGLVETGELDLAFVMPPLEGRVVCEQLYSGEYVALLPPGSALAASTEPIHLAELESVPLIVYNHVRSVNQVDTFFRVRGLRPNVVLRADENSLVQALVSEGVAAAIVPPLAVYGMDNMPVAVRVVTDCPHLWSVAIAWQRDRLLPPVLEDFIYMARKAANEAFKETIAPLFSTFGSRTGNPGA